MFSDEKIFAGDGQINRKNDVIYAKSRKQANYLGEIHQTHKFPHKVMVWIGMTWNGLTEPMFLPPKTFSDTNFYAKHVSLIVKRDGTKLLE